MKKLLIGLLSVVLFIGNAVAQNEVLEFELDPVATANAPWKVGEKIVERIYCGLRGSFSCYRVFWGINTNNHVLAQDFYVTGNKFTDPFIVSSLDSVSREWTRYLQAGQKGINYSIEGKITLWHENGEKWAEGYYQNGKPNGVLQEWDENGKKISGTIFENGEVIESNKF